MLYGIIGTIMAISAFHHLERSFPTIYKKGMPPKAVKSTVLGHFMKSNPDHPINRGEISIEDELKNDVATLDEISEQFTDNERMLGRKKMLEHVFYLLPSIEIPFNFYIV
uniref:CNNM transmembrane domain-containing protein n=1 Tax=Rhabditophanes sp. KR3021 TaxID=114890 RepID=A0AC35TFX0_9BILA